jgi:hypothetical protein
MPDRTELQKLLKDTLGTDNVYFRPPTNLTLSYPCIVYTRERIAIKHADSMVYMSRKLYTITFISKNPDDPILDALASIPGILHDRSFMTAGLNHDVFKLHF